MEFSKKRLSENNKNEVAKKQKIGSTKGEPLTCKQKAEKLERRSKIKYEVPHIRIVSFAPKKEKGKKFAKERRSKNKKNEVAKKQKSKKFRKPCFVSVISSVVRKPKKVIEWVEEWDVREEEH